MSKGGATTRTQLQQRAYDQIKAVRKQGFLHVEGRCQAIGDNGRKCSKSARELHHEDYSKPLDVHYYCSGHNRRLGKGCNA